MAHASLRTSAEFHCQHRTFDVYTALTDADNADNADNAAMVSEPGRAHNVTKDTFGNSDDDDDDNSNGAGAFSTRAHALEMSKNFCVCV